MFGLGPTEVVIILIVALVVFGPSRLPKIGQMAGEAVGHYKKHKNVVGDVQTAVKKDLEDMILGQPSNN